MKHHKLTGKNLDLRAVEPPGKKDRKWRCSFCGKEAPLHDLLFNVECDNAPEGEA